MTNKLMTNLLKVHAMMETIDKFVNIKVHIENLDMLSPAAKELVRQTDTLVKVLEAFSHRQPKL